MQAWVGHERVEPLICGVLTLQMAPLSLQVLYKHDGSHADTYKGWARFVGHITEVS